MAYQNQGGFVPRELHDVSAMNIKCCDCGAPIDKLPFNPDPARLDSIRCRECLRNRKPSYGGRS
ncbi:MAG: hypothetical protein AAB731_00550 [Patescibacteria group bacterium]